MDKFFEIDTTIAKLYSKYGESFFDAEETSVFFDSLTTMAKAKFLFLVAYELQEMEQGIDVVMKFDEFLSRVQKEVFEDESESKMFNGLLCMARALSKQCVVPKTFEDLMKKAEQEVNKKDYFTLVVTYLLDAFSSIGECEEEDFGKNIMLRCIYDYETDYIYNILRSYLKPLNTVTKVPLDHTIAFADYDPRLINILATNLNNYLSINGVPSNNSIQVNLDYS